MRKIIIALMVISSIPVLGQNHIIGLKGGINLTNVNSSIFKENNDNRNGFNCGLTYEYLLDTYFNIGTDVLYFQKGFTDDMIFTGETGNPTGEKTTFIFNYDYLSIPIKGGLHLGDKISGFVNFGVIPSILIDAKTIEPAIAGFTNEKSIDVTGQVRRFDFGGLIEIGGSFQFRERYVIFTSFAYLQSFTTITNSQYFTGSKIKHYGMTMSIGLKYILNKE